MATHSLPFYPLDILRMILDYLDAYNLTSLWKCGDKRLNFVLCEIVRRFELVYEAKPENLERHVWPTIISHFSSLETLIVASPDPNLSLVVSSVDLSLIPRSIRRLELRFANGLEVCVHRARVRHGKKEYAQSTFLPILKEFQMYDSSFKHMSSLNRDFYYLSLSTIR